MQYQMIYGHNANDTPGRLTLDADNDAESQKEVCDFVAQGYRNSTWGNITLTTGQIFGARNMDGSAVGRIVDLCN